MKGPGPRLAAALMLVGTACSSAREPTGGPARTGPDDRSAQTEASAPPSSRVGANGILDVGVSGSAGWKLTTTTLATTFDAGEHWTSTSLPNDVSAGRIGSVCVVADRGLWLAVPGRAGVVVYRHMPDDNGWQHTEIPAHPGIYLGGARPSATIVPGPRHDVLLVVSWGLSTFTSINQLHVSTDDGAHFGIARDTGTRESVADIVFADALHGLASGQPTGNYSQLFHTADGGVTWSPVDIPDSLTRRQQAQIGSPFVDGGTVRLPITVNDTRTGAQRMTIYSSTDTGATFTAAVAKPLLIAPRNDAGEEPVAFHGPDVWVPARGVIFESSDAGQQWTTVRSTGAPFELGLIDANHAIGMAQEAGCRHFKSDCYSYRYLVATDDGGRTWRPV